MRHRLFSVPALALTLLSACSSSDSSPPAGSGGALDDDAAIPEDAATGDDAALQAPQLDQLMKMAGALHVFWTNVQPDCDSVRLERSTDAAAWAERFTLPGTADNKMDATATANVTYTFRLRCEKGGAFSEYSNELSMNPTQ